ncbi:MAG: ORF6N domain-containing protein [Smithella sp.]
MDEAVRNNPEKFPNGYLFELDKKDWEIMKSKFSTSFAPTAGGKVKLPKAFPEKGLSGRIRLIRCRKYLLFYIHGTKHAV